ncbi:unnamed protein product [Closterium sp. Naga37s-1]|nr:unnamed protein product [Closterium sp. Naga37s-1]
MAAGRGAELRGGAGESATIVGGATGGKQGDGATGASSNLLGPISQCAVTSVVAENSADSADRMSTESRSAEAGGDGNGANSVNGGDGANGASSYPSSLASWPNESPSAVTSPTTSAASETRSAASWTCAGAFPAVRHPVRPTSLALVSKRGRGSVSERIDTGRGAERSAGRSVGSSGGSRRISFPPSCSMGDRSRSESSRGTASGGRGGGGGGGGGGVGHRSLLVARTAALASARPTAAAGGDATGRRNRRARLAITTHTSFPLKTTKATCSSGISASDAERTNGCTTAGGGKECSGGDFGGSLTRDSSGSGRDGGAGSGSRGKGGAGGRDADKARPPWGARAPGAVLKANEVLTGVERRGGVLSGADVRVEGVVSAGTGGKNCEGHVERVADTGAGADEGGEVRGVGEASVAGGIGEEATQGTVDAVGKKGEDDGVWTGGHQGEEGRESTMEGTQRLSWEGGVAAVADHDAAAAASIDSCASRDGAAPVGEKSIASEVDEGEGAQGVREDENEGESGGKGCFIRGVEEEECEEEVVEGEAVPPEREGSEESDALCGDKAGMRVGELEEQRGESQAPAEKEDEEQEREEEGVEKAKDCGRKGTARGETLECEQELLVGRNSVGGSGALEEVALEAEQSLAAGGALAADHADADAVADAEADAAADSEADARPDAGVDAGADAEADSGAGVRSDVRADAEADAEVDVGPAANAVANAGVDGGAEARSDDEADARADAEANARADAEANARADAEANARADAEANARADAEANARADAEANARADAEANARADAEANARADAEANARADAEADAEAEPFVVVKGEEDKEAGKEQGEYNDRNLDAATAALAKVRPLALRLRAMASAAAASSRVKAKAVAAEAAAAAAAEAEMLAEEADTEGDGASEEEDGGEGVVRGVLAEGVGAMHGDSSMGAGSPVRLPLCLRPPLRRREWIRCWRCVSSPPRRSRPTNVCSPPPTPPVLPPFFFRPPSFPPPHRRSRRLPCQAGVDSVLALCLKSTTSLETNFENANKLFIGNMSNVASFGAFCVEIKETLLVSDDGLSIYPAPLPSFFIRQGWTLPLWGPAPDPSLVNETVQMTLTNNGVTDLSVTGLDFTQFGLPADFSVGPGLSANLTFNRTQVNLDFETLPLLQTYLSGTNPPDLQADEVISVVIVKLYPDDPDGLLGRAAYVFLKPTNDQINPYEFYLFEANYYLPPPTSSGRRRLLAAIPKTTSPPSGSQKGCCAKAKIPPTCKPGAPTWPSCRSPPCKTPC